MPRKRKTDRTFDGFVMENAVKFVLEKGESLRGVAARFGLKKSNLGNYVNKTRKANNRESVSYVPNFKSQQILSDEIENNLKEYLLKCSTILFGLTPKKLRQLALGYAVKNGCPVPKNWLDSQCASRDWFTGYMSRHPDLSLRAPEANLARMTVFNQHMFFEKLHEVLTRYSFQSHQIYNLGETGVTTVVKIPKVISKKVEKEDGQEAAERVELITQVGIICAAGGALPPVWIFPRERFDEKRIMMNGVTDEGALGLVHPSGLMSDENFVEVLHHLAKFSRCSTGNKILLIVDNHKVHLTVDVLSFCEKNGIVLLTFPSNTTAKLRPLDACVFGPFNTFLSQGIDSWMTDHPGQPITIFELPSICCTAWYKAATPSNVKKGFSSTGIDPFGRNIFKEEDFLSLFVTDQPALPVSIDSSISQVNIKEESVGDEALESSPADPLIIKEEPVDWEDASSSAIHINEEQVSEANQTSPDVTFSKKLIPSSSAPPKRAKKSRGFDYVDFDETDLSGHDSGDITMHQPQSSFSPWQMDETDMFFLSMARMTKTLSGLKRAQIKSRLSNDVLQAVIEREEQNKELSASSLTTRFFTAGMLKNS